MADFDREVHPELIGLCDLNLYRAAVASGTTLVVLASPAGSHDEYDEPPFVRSRDEGRGVLYCGAVG
jgi:hypothetical protein